MDGSHDVTRDQRYRTADVPVDGGPLRVGVWEPVGPDVAGTVLLVHGVTASHRAWLQVVDALPHWRVVAPDLRGRGRSRDLPAPYGMVRHADDLAAVAASVDGVDRVVGHSMGAFATLVLGHRHPSVVRDGVVLVDGGVPLPVPPQLADLTPEQLVTATLGPAAARLDRSFPDRGSYRDLFRAHPALTDAWGPDLLDYVDYDLVEDGGELRSATRREAMLADSADLFGDGAVTAALDALAHPTPVLRAPRGLLDGDPLYPPGSLQEAARRWPALRPAEVPDVNHYTVVMSGPGAAAVAEAVTGGVR